MISFNPSSLASQFANFFGTKQGQGTSQGTQVSLRSQTQTGISILTAEGDKVTLSTKHAFEGTGVRFNYRGVLEGQPISLRANALEGQFSSFEGLQVEGDLNEQEIQDIQKVIARTQGLVDDLASGDINAAFARGRQVSASGSLAAIGVNIQHSESLSINQSSQSVTANGYPPFLGPPVTETSDKETIASGSQPVGSSELSLRGILGSIFKNLGLIPNPDQQTQEAEDGESSDRLGNLLDKVSSKFERRVEGLKGFLDKVQDNLTDRAEKIAKFATKLKDRVEQQAGKITKAFKQLAELGSQGITSGEKVDRLNEQIANRSEQLANEVSDYSSKIADKVEGLENFIDSSSERIVRKAEHVEDLVDRFRDRITDELDGGTNAAAEELFDEFDRITGDGGLTQTLTESYGQGEEAVAQNVAGDGSGNGSGAEVGETEEGVNANSQPQNIEIIV
jgi:predicted  nucleic acid-binding Zn-ribbon protein